MRAIVGLFAFVAATSATRLNALDLTAAEVIPAADQFKLLHDPAGDYLLTGSGWVSREDTTMLHYLAVSQVFPSDAPSTPAGRDAFAGSKRRPATWDEARDGCKALQIRGKEWSLPSVWDIKALNNRLHFREKILAAEGEVATPIANGYGTLSKGLKQLEYFWMREGVTGNDAPGLRTAAAFGPNGYFQSMTEDRLLSYVCTTTFTGPNIHGIGILAKGARVISKGL